MLFRSVGRTGRAITFATSKQAGDLKEVERVVKAPIGEWEPPEERLEHAPTPRHREGPPPEPAPDPWLRAARLEAVGHPVDAPAPWGPW